ncbi:MAG TPA: NYN domain-containing protein [Sedimentisphaerales bacterium]|nr:NYN domain-containing protein [Sedimentisphaerales bacterium]
MTKFPGGPAIVPQPTVTGPMRFRVFVDYWNLQLSLNERESEATGHADSRFLIDFKRLPACLTQHAAIMVGASHFSYEGVMIFTSYNPQTLDGRKFHKWATSWLDRQPGIQVKCSERRPRHHPKCPTCHKPIATCPDPECGADLAGTVEKGVDTAIATDMIRLAWEQAYDVAVLASSDADLIPAVEFLDQKGLKVIQAGFPPLGSHLSRACWGTVDMFAIREEFRRTAAS